MRFFVASLSSSFLLASSLTWSEPVSTNNTGAVTPIPQSTQTTGTVKPQTPTTIQTAKPTTSTPPLVEPNSPAQVAQKKAEEDAKIKALVKNQESRMQQLEKANLDALAENQALQLKTDNLGVQVQVLQSERTAQLFMYGAATLGIGVFIGFLLAGYIYTKRRRQW